MLGLQRLDIAFAGEGDEGLRRGVRESLMKSHSAESMSFLGRGVPDKLP